MSDEQIKLIKYYHTRTPHYEVPLWVYGLRIVSTNNKYVTDFYMPWDYGLNMDCQLLCRHRHGARLPFVFMPGL